MEAVEEELPELSASAAPALGIAQTEYNGRVKSYNTKQGYGFLACPEAKADYGRDVFIHKAQMGELLGQFVGPGTRLEPAAFLMQVRFSVEINKKGFPQARDVARVGGSADGPAVSQDASAEPELATSGAGEGALEAVPRRPSPTPPALMSEGSPPEAAPPEEPDGDQWLDGLARATVRGYKGKGGTIRIQNAEAQQGSGEGAGAPAAAAGSAGAAPAASPAAPLRAGGQKGVWNRGWQSRERRTTNQPAAGHLRGSVDIKTAFPNWYDDAQDDQHDITGQYVGRSRAKGSGAFGRTSEPSKTRRHSRQNSDHYWVEPCEQEPYQDQNGVYPGQYPENLQGYVGGPGAEQLPQCQGSYYWLASEQYTLFPPSPQHQSMPCQFASQTSPVSQQTCAPLGQQPLPQCAGQYLQYPPQPERQQQQQPQQQQPQQFLPQQEQQQQQQQQYTQMVVSQQPLSPDGRQGFLPPQSPVGQVQQQSLFNSETCQPHLVVGSDSESQYSISNLAGSTGLNRDGAVTPSSGSEDDAALGVYQPPPPQVDPTLLLCGTAAAPPCSMHGQLGVLPGVDPFSGCLWAQPVETVAGVGQTL